MRWRTILILGFALSLAAPVQAGILFGRKTKPNPKERVPELIAIVKADGDERKRSEAATELRQYDIAAFPEITPVLIDVLLNDKKPSVRSEAAQSLGKIRPISQSAGLALEQALANDKSMSVRLHARSALFGYRWAGYKSLKKDEPLIEPKDGPAVEVVENPASKPAETTKAEEPLPRSFIRKARSLQRVPVRGTPASQTRPSDSTPPTIAPIPSARPLPVGPANPTIRTTEPPLAEPEPAPAPATKAPKGSAEGPSLDP